MECADMILFGSFGLPPGVFVSYTHPTPVSFTMADFQLPPGSISFPEIEEEVLKYWQEIKAFETQMELTKHKPKYYFLDGPPFATGLPHYGHLLAGTIKDAVCRYYA